MMSNKLSYLEDFKRGVSWSSLDASCKANLASQNPVSFYWNLQYAKYQNVIDDNMSSMEKSGMELVMKQMDCIAGYGNQKEGSIDILMTPQKKNALWRIIEMVDEAASKF